MDLSQKTKDRLPRKLEAFEDYEDYLDYAQTMFELTPDEYAALFQVLLKLESAGSDPLETMQTCRFEMSPDDCLDMLKFMIYVDGLDLAAIREMV